MPRDLNGPDRCPRRTQYRTANDPAVRSGGPSPGRTPMHVSVHSTRWRGDTGPSVGMRFVVVDGKTVPGVGITGVLPVRVSQIGPCDLRGRPRCSQSAGVWGWMWMRDRLWRMRSTGRPVRSSRAGCVPCPRGGHGVGSGIAGASGDDPEAGPTCSRSWPGLVSRHGVRTVVVGPSKVRLRHWIGYSGRRSGFVAVSPAVRLPALRGRLRGGVRQRDRLDRRARPSPPTASTPRSCAGSGACARSPL